MQQISSSRKLQYIIRAIGAIFLTLIFTAIFIGFFWLGNTFVKVQKIIIEGEDKVQLRRLSSYYQKNILFLSTKGMEESLLESNPELQSVLIEKKFPNSLVITVTLQPIVAILEMNEGYSYLSEKGKIIRKSRDKKGEYPFIHYYQKMNYTSFSAGTDIKYIDILSALHFVKKLSNLGLQTDTVDINGVDMLLFTIGDKNILFTTEKDTRTQDYELEQITRQFKIEGKEFKSLDLRFEKPIIIF